MNPPTVAVVGGGISGLVVAYRLRRSLGAAARIVVLERSSRLGGKLRTVPLAGDPVDVYVNDRHIARGEVLVLNDNFCVRINEIIQNPDAEGPPKRRP